MMMLVHGIYIVFIHTHFLCTIVNALIHKYLDYLLKRMATDSQQKVIVHSVAAAVFSRIQDPSSVVTILGAPPNKELFTLYTRASLFSLRAEQWPCQPVAA